MVFASNRVIRLPSGKVFFSHKTFRACAFSGALVGV